MLRVFGDAEVKLVGDHCNTATYSWTLLFSGTFDGEHYFLLDPVGKNRTRQGGKFSNLLVGLLSRTLSATEAGFEAMNTALKQQAGR